MHAKNRISRSMTVALLAGAFFTSTALAADWPMFLGNQTHVAYAEKAPTPPLELKWRFMTGGPVYASPAVSGGRVFAGSYDGNLYAIDAKSGKELWRFKTGGEIFSSPAVSGGNVYVGSKDGAVYCVNAETGKEVWKFSSEGAVMTSPVVAQDMVFVASMDLYAYGLDAKTGQRVWRNKLTDFERYSGIYASPAFSEGAVFVAGKNGIIYSLSGKSGARNWTKKTGSAIYASPVIKDGMLYVVSYDRTLYVSEAATGKFVWRKNIDNDFVYASPAVTKDKIFVPLKKGVVKVFNRLDGSEAGSFSFFGEINSTPVVTGANLMFVTCDDGKLYAVDLYKKEIVWQFATNASIQASPAVVDNTVFAASQDGGIYALEGK